MNYYLHKYVGKYRVKAAIDQNTNDFCRDEHGNLENNMDVWIKCANGIKIFHYGGSTLQVYIPSIGRGRNIIKYIYRDHINPNNVNVSICTTERDGKEVIKESLAIIDESTFSKDISKTKLIFDIEETDEEVLFKVMDKNLEKIVDRLKPQTSGADISPFSSRNLPKTKTYQYTNEQENAYKTILEHLNNKLVIGRINNAFLADVVCKKSRQDLNFIKYDIKSKCMKVRDYIYSEGYEKEYLQYLKEKIKMEVLKN